MVKWRSPFKRTLLFDEAQQQFGSLDILVNNAGTKAGGGVVETDEDAFGEMFGLNVKGTFFYLNGCVINWIAGHTFQAGSGYI